MAPSPITEDYYAVLEVGQHATAVAIKASYKRLAFKLHPDRNNAHDATKAFQELQQACETLSNESARAAYDLLYPSIIRSQHKPPTTKQGSRPEAASSSKPANASSSDEAKIAELRKSKQARAARWSTRKTTLEGAVFEVQRIKRRLEQETKNLASFAAAERAEEAARNSWGSWLLSPLYKKAKETEEEKAAKERRRQERKIEKDLKERRLSSLETDLRMKQQVFSTALAEVQAADACDDGKIRAIEARLEARERAARWEKERAEQERQAKIWKQRREEQEAKERAEAEDWARQMAERQAAARIRQEVETRQRQRQDAEEARQHLARHARRTKCEHYGWWDKVHGWTTCPECYSNWSYLLECPQCDMRACPKCQAAIRERQQGRVPRAGQRKPQGFRSPSPQFTYDDGDYWD